MPEVTPPKFVAIQVSPPDEERFVLLETATLGFRPFAQPGSTADRVAAMHEAVMALPRLSEADLRGQLADRGESPADIDRCLARARRMATLLPAGGPVSFAVETITRVGYRNADGQEVVRKTGRTGPDNQRVFVLRCQVCGHEYGTYGCDADIRRCPACQDGPPGLPC